MKKPLTPQQAAERLADACSRAEYCTAELRQKLRRWQVPAADAQAIVEELQRKRFVDDDRYARAFVRQKVAFARWGRRKIAAALAAKRITGAAAREALDTIDAAEYAAALRAVVAAKARSLGPEALATYEGRTRLFRHAASRGFETELISKTIKQLMTS